MKNFILFNYIKILIFNFFNFFLLIKILTIMCIYAMNLARQLFKLNTNNSKRNGGPRRWE